MDDDDEIIIPLNDFNYENIEVEVFSESGDFLSDDDDCDADFNAMADQIDPEHSYAINQHLQRVELDGNTTDAFLSDINATIDLNEVELPSAQSSFINLDEVTIEEQPSTSAADILSRHFQAMGKRPPKRARSPMPTIEATGPAIVPNDGGFNGKGMYTYDYYCSNK